MKATLSYLDSAILPALGHLRVGSIVRADIARFFHEYGRRKPGGANRSHDILRNRFDCAIAWGHRAEAAGNPCKVIVRYRRPPRGRLLGAGDLARLGAVLRWREDDRPACAAAVRLILLTGCRPGEIRRLRWCEVRPDRLAPTDSKTGSRHVLLGAAARELLGGLVGTASGEWVFPGDGADEPLVKNDLYKFWTRARREAGIVTDAAARPAACARLARGDERGKPACRGAPARASPGEHDQPLRPCGGRDAGPGRRTGGGRHRRRDAPSAVPAGLRRRCCRTAVAPPGGRTGHPVRRLCHDGVSLHYLTENIR